MFINFRGTILMLGIVLISTQLVAQNQPAAPVKQTYNSDTLNVEGYIDEETPVTDGELENIKSTAKKYKTDNKLFKEKTKALNQVTNEAEKLGDNAEEKIMSQVEMKKAENKALEKIKRAESKLKCLTEESQRSNPECQEYYPEQDQVTQTFAAPAPEVTPVVVTEVQPTVADLNSPFEEIKIIPYLGATNYKGNTEELETEMAGGLNIESNINKRFSMGIGLHYAQLKTEDYASNGLLNQYYTYDYYNFYGNAREIQFKNFGFDIYGKFFITRGERFRPYVGSGLGYSRMSLKYNDNESYSFDGNEFGDEEFTTGYANLSLFAGSEVLITKGFGLNLEFKYSKGFGGGDSTSNVNSLYAPDQKRLEELSNEIIESNALSMFLGAVIAF